MKNKLMKVLIVFLFLLVSFTAVSCDGKAPIVTRYCPDCHFQFNIPRGLKSRTCPTCHKIVYFD